MSLSCIMSIRYAGGSLIMHLNTKVRILDSVLSHTGNQCSAIKQSIELSAFVFPSITLATIFGLSAVSLYLTLAIHSKVHLHSQGEMLPFYGQSIWLHLGVSTFMMYLSFCILSITALHFKLIRC